MQQTRQRPPCLAAPEQDKYDGQVVRPVASRMNRRRYALRVSADAPGAVLRIRPEALASTWWDAVSRRPDAPPAVDALLTGRQRVEVTVQEATQALTWARSVDGWAAADPKPLFVHHLGSLHT